MRPIAISQRQPYQAAQERQGHRLDEELQQDVAAPRAQALQDADLAGTLRDRHQHDVHDADATHQERDADDAAEDGARHVEDLVDAVGELRCGLDLEIIVLSWLQVMLAAQHPLMTRL